MSQDTIGRPGYAGRPQPAPGLTPLWSGRGRRPRLLLLLRREFWEHRGSFLWAPVLAASVMLLLMAVLLVVAVWSDELRPTSLYVTTVMDTLPDGAVVPTQRVVTINHFEVADDVGRVLRYGILALFALVGAIVAIIVFFYVLGAVHDERRDRSILFWRSLPVSDAESVMAKALSAGVVAPGIGLLVTLAGAIVVLGMAGLAVWLGTELRLGAVWAAADLRETFLALAATLPVWLTIALPTIGWLMLCSAWARSKPFLWAVGIPVAAGLLVSTWTVVRGFAAASPELAGWF